MKTDICFIPYHEIDRERYTNCIRNAKNYLIYAESWFLDIVSEKKWDCVVINNYEAVMPLPYKKKMGIKYFVQPSFCQQLGVFYREFLSQEMIESCLLILKRKSIKSYQFNESNKLESYISKQLKVKKNQLIHIASSEEEIRKKLRRDRRNDINKNLVDITFNSEIYIPELIALVQQEYTFYLQEKKLYNLLQTASNKEVLIQKSCLKEGVILASIVLLKSKQRLIYLFSARNKNYKKSPYISQLIFKIMQEYPNHILDFEGSEIEGIADFYKSFGAESMNYYHYHNFKKIPLVF